jgi:molecular chaperone GrpE
MEDPRNNNNDVETNESSDDKLLLLQKKLEALEKELTDEKKHHLRTRADFENYRKRIEREDENRRLNIKKEILSDLISFLEYFDQARKQLQDESAAKGMAIMARQFDQLLQKHGVQPIECLGLPYDPEAQEGIGFVDTDKCEDGCVAEQICSGYLLNDILLKPAKVLVAKKKEEQH